MSLIVYSVCVFFFCFSLTTETKMMRKTVTITETMVTEMVRKVVSVFVDEQISADTNLSDMLIWFVRFL